MNRIGKEAQAEVPLNSKLMSLKTLKAAFLEEENQIFKCLINIRRCLDREANHNLGIVFKNDHFP